MCVKGKCHCARTSDGREFSGSKLTRTPTYNESSYPLRHLFKTYQTKIRINIVNLYLGVVPLVLLTEIVKLK